MWLRIGPPQRYHDFYGLMEVAESVRGGGAGFWPVNRTSWAVERRQSSRNYAGWFFFLLASFSRDRESENSENVAVTSCRKLMSDGCASFLYAWRWIRRWNGETLRWAIFGGETCERFIGGQWPRIPSGFLPLWSPAILSGRSCCCSGTRSSGILFYALFGTFSGVRFQSRILCNVKKPVWRSLIEWDEQFWERKK